MENYFNSEWIISIALGVSLSAACGFRVFVPLLATSIAAKLGFIQVSNDLMWMNSNTAILCFGVATLIEIVAYYLPFVDNVLDTIATPLALISGSIIASAVFIDIDPLTRWILGIIVGGGSAGLIQAGTVLARLGSSKFTMGTGNALFAIGEHTASITTVLLAFIFPILVCILFVLLMIIAILLIVRSFRK